MARARCWKVNLGRFTRWGDLVNDDWQGKKRTNAGLDELSELSEEYAEQKTTYSRARKRPRQR